MHNNKFKVRGKKHREVNNMKINFKREKVIIQIIIAVTDSVITCVFGIVIISIENCIENRHDHFINLKK